MICHTKACSIACVMPFFWSPFTSIVGRINICWGLLSLTWKTFIHLDTMFPPLLNIIPLVGLDVLIEIIQEFLNVIFKCSRTCQPTSYKSEKLKLKQNVIY
jgi:hypothetical protein